ncbi:MAG: HEAT repeat domain-containing protein [Phycisphaerales bacterium]|nr:MAG: HEAT repeat domain-containing protein [Phycisphaerales bacterium]
MTAARKRLGAMLALCCLAASAAACRAAADESEIDRILAPVADYKGGTGTEALAAVEKLIRESQGIAERRKHIELRLAGMLESDISLDAKLFICRQLWFIGTADSVPAVAKLLLDEQTADMACYAIGQNESEEAGEALREALGKVSPGVQVRIINLLGDRRDRQAVDAMAPLVFGADEQVSEAVVAALGKIGGGEAIAMLGRARAEGGSDLKLAATDAYLRCAEDLAAAGRKGESAAIYRELTGEEEEPFVRSAAVKGLADTGGPDAVGIVVAALQDSDRMVRTTARGCVRTMEGEGVTERFAAELAKISGAERIGLLGALADRGDPAALGAVMAFAEDGDVEVRKAALQAVGKLGDVSSVPLLVKAVGGDAGSVEMLAARRSLELLGGEGVDDAIVESMLASEPSVRARLIGVLSNRNAAGAVPELLKEAAGPEAGVRKAAFRALGRLAEPRDLSLLLTLLVNLPEDQGRREAERAVVAVARKGAGRMGRTDPVLRVLQARKSTGVRCSLLRVLGGIADVESLYALEASLKDPDPTIYDTAVRELANWPNADAAPALAGVFGDAKSRTHRILSLRGFVRLLNLPSQDLAVQKKLDMYKAAVAHVELPEEKKLFLAGLANVAHPEALEIAAAYVNYDDGVRAEAVLAAIRIARGVCGSHPDKAKAVARRVLTLAAGDLASERAEEIIKIIAGFGDYMTAWQVCGPFGGQAGDYQQLFDTAFGPEKPGAGPLNWRLMPAGRDLARPWVLDVSSIFGGEQRVAYLRTWVNSETQQQVRLEIGSDDGVKVWLNGALVHANTVTRSFEPGSDRVDLSLQKGWNYLLVKLARNGESWLFCARLRTLDGSAVGTAGVDCMREMD